MASGKRQEVGVASGMKVGKGSSIFHITSVLSWSRGSKVRKGRGRSKIQHGDDPLPF